jgi:16S rRNA (guanine527-N7)-methyltransferase
LLIEGAAQLGVGLDPATCDRLLVYLTELMKWSRRINLIARDTPEDQAIETHFLDSLTLVPLLREAEAPIHLLDVGTGAGFPGLVLAIVLPEARFTLVEPRQKRVTFLRHLILRTLGLTNASVVADRIEPHVATWCGQFSHITSRAVAEPSLFLPLVRPLVTPETRIILMLAREEALAGIEEGASGPWRIATTRALTLPFSGAPRLLAVVRAHASRRAELIPSPAD